jgi:hypothetical protein
MSVLWTFSGFRVLSLLSSRFHFFKNSKDENYLRWLGLGLELSKKSQIFKSLRQRLFSTGDS